MRRSWWDRRSLRWGALVVTLALFALWAPVTGAPDSFTGPPGFSVGVPRVQIDITEGFIRLAYSTQWARFTARWCGGLFVGGSRPWLCAYDLVQLYPSGVAQILCLRLSPLVALAGMATALLWRAHGRTQKARWVRRAGASSSDERLVRLLTAAFLFLPFSCLQVDLLPSEVPAARRSLWPLFLLPSIVLAYLTGRWFARLTSWRAVPDGYCACGYNLTGNTSGVCPECGVRR